MGIALPAGADPKQQPPAGTTSAYLASVDPATLARREALMDYKAWLVSLPGLYEQGFVESANFADTKSVTLLWVGSSPLQDVARKEADKRGIKATVQPVRHSRAQLRQATDRLLATAKDARWNGFVITSVVGTDLDHDGLEVQGHYAGVGTAEAEARLPEVRATAQSIAAEVVGVKITEAPVDLVTRSTDEGPFNAGGMMRAPDRVNGCTSGFGIWLDGVARTTTARHCNQTPYEAWDLRTQVYGNTHRVVSGSAAAVLTGGGFYWMFDGAWNDSNGFRKTVVGYAHLSINDWVCTSGANSGVHCSIQVDNLSVAHNDGQGWYLSITAIHRGGDVAAVGGDSGGPVMVPYANPNWSTVGAAGMIQWGTDERSCGSTRVPTRCFQKVGFTSMHTIVTDLGPGARLRTG